MGDLNAFIPYLTGLMTAAVSSGLTWWATRRSMQPAALAAAQAQVDVERQRAVDNLVITQSALERRVQLLEQERSEIEAKHEGEITELRGQFQSDIARKNLDVTDLQRKLDGRDQEMTKRDQRIIALEKKQGEMAMALAEYALRDPARRTRRTDLRAAVAEVVAPAADGS